MLIPVITPDIEIDIEKELSGGDKAHALPFCNDHRGPQFFPVAGTITETICGILIRIRTFIARPKQSEKCEKCATFQGKTFNCYYCGKEIIG